MTKDVLESSRIYPAQVLLTNHEPNNTGGVLIRPGGRDCYPAFWVRDYAMSLESGFIKQDEQKHMLALVAKTQCNQSWVSDGGGFIPFGAIADHISISTSEPSYYPGSQAPQYGILPSFDDHFYFIHMAYYYATNFHSYNFLLQKINGFSLVDRLEMAYKVPTTGPHAPIVYTTDSLRGVDFGFRDVVTITGDLCFTSILKYQASLEMAWLFEKLQQQSKAKAYKNIAADLKQLIPRLFYDNRGMLKASNRKSQQLDVWATALAIYYGILDGEKLNKASQYLTDGYINGSLSYKGNIRHVLTTDDFSGATAWEFADTEKNTYQNGAYWGTPTGWLVYAIAQTNPDAAKKLAGEYIAELRENDYRKGKDFGAPYECFHPSGYNQNPVYLASVSCPFEVFKKMMGE